VSSNVQQSDASVRDGIIEVVQRISGGASDADEALRAMDSLDLVELVVALEEQFRIEIPDTRLNDRVLSSVHALSGLVSGLLAA
jgi:acyl carrier protein